MMYDTPMLADFAVRLSFGLAVMLLTASWRSCSAAVLPNSMPGHSWPLGPGISGRVEIGGIGLYRRDLDRWCRTCLHGDDRLGPWASPGRRARDLAIVLTAAGWLILASRSVSPVVWAFNSASRAASGFLLGATLAAMLLGHHYLTAPAMSIEPLKRFVRCMGWGLVVACAGRNSWHLSCPLGPFRHATAHGRREFVTIPPDALVHGICLSDGGDFSSMEDRANSLDPIGHGNSLCGHGPGALR